MTPEGEPAGFCGKAQEKKPPEAYFAVEGEEEKLPTELERQSPRRGLGEGEKNDERHQQAVSNIGATEAAVTEGRAEGEASREERIGRGLADDAVVTPSDGLFVRTPEEPPLGAGAAAEGAEPPAWRHSGGSFPDVDFEARSSPSREEGTGLGVNGNVERWRRRRRRRRRDGGRGKKEEGWGHGRVSHDTGSLGVPRKELTGGDAV